MGVLAISRSHETDGIHASFQNGMAERPNRTLGDMMRSLLYGANLGPQYWSWALLHSVYLKNRLPNMSTGTTPYEAYTGIKPDINKLKVFGCPVIACLPGKRPAKLEVHAAMGIFLGFTATDHNIYYQDIATKKKLKLPPMSRLTKPGTPYPHRTCPKHNVVYSFVT